MLTNEDIDHQIATIKTARLHKSRHQAYAKLFGHAFSGGTFTHFQWDRISEDKHYHTQLCHHIAFLDPKTCNPSTPMAQKMAQEYVKMVTTSKEFPVYVHPIAATPMVAFAAAFPNQAASLAQKAIEERMVVDTYNFNALKAYMKMEDIGNLIPYNIQALRTMALYAGSALEDRVREMFESLHDKQMPQVACEDIEAAADLCNRLPQDITAWVIANFTQIFSAQQCNKKKYRPKALEIAFANFILLVKDAPEELYANAVKKISTEEIYGHRNRLLRPFTIPPEETGEPLCWMICWLEELPDRYLKNIRGLPPEDQLRAKTIEVQMGKSQLFENTINAMDRLKLRINGLPPHRDHLLEHLFTIASRPTALQELLQSLHEGNIPYEDSAKLLLHMTDIIRHKSTGLPQKMFNYDLSMASLSEKEAKKMLEILQATGWSLDPERKKKP